MRDPVLDYQDHAAEAQVPLSSPDAAAEAQVPLSSPDAAADNPHCLHHHEPIGGYSQFFEFPTDATPQTFPADAIIFCGKLFPLKGNPPPVSGITAAAHKDINNKSTGRLRRRSDSLCQSEPTLPVSSDSRRFLGFHRFHDYRSKSSRSGTQPVLPDINCCSSGKGTGDRLGPPPVRRSGRFRWHPLLFGGLANLPPETALDDAKSRRVRRPPTATISPQVERRGKLPAGRGGGNAKKGSPAAAAKKGWPPIMSALTCRLDSVAVESSIGNVKRLGVDPPRHTVRM